MWACCLAFIARRFYHRAYSAHGTSDNLVVSCGLRFAAFVLHRPFGFAPASLTVSRPYFLFSMSTTSTTKV
jgi:hypothetical protein